MRNIIIIGAGAAGLTAAAYALDKQLDVLVISENVGGKVGWQRRVANEQTAPASLAEQTMWLLADQILERKDITLHDTVSTILPKSNSYEVVTSQHGIHEAQVVIVATGVTPIPLEVPGASNLLGYGLGYSAIAQAARMHGKTVAAIGSSHRAIRGVHELSRIAEKVYWVVDQPHVLTDPLGIAVQYRSNVEVLDGYQVTQVDGSFHIQAIEVANKNDKRRLEVDAAFIDHGLTPHSQFLSHLVRTNIHGFIEVDANGATSETGIFAAGDVSTAVGEQLLLAMGQGSRAAASAYEYILAHPLTLAVH